jgi:hypothetical protein
MLAKAAAAALATLVVVFMASLALARPEEQFSVSPGGFKVVDAPLLGEPYRIERKLVIRNGDNVRRTFLLSVKIPPAENLGEGYEPIPDPSWVILMPAVIEIENGSSGIVDILLNFPREENLTNRKWEAWISVSRQEELGEIAKLEIISVARIETASELPPPPSRLPMPVAAIGLVGGVAVAFLLGSLARRRRRQKRPALLRISLAGFFLFSNRFKKHSLITSPAMVLNLT